MTTLFEPIIDNLETIANNLSSAIVESWDMNDCIGFCVTKLDETMKTMPLDEFVEQYETFHLKSIVTEINWPEITGRKIDWNNVCSCVCNPSMMDGFGQFYTVGNDDDDVELWIVEIHFHGGAHMNILHARNQEEAEIIARSINDFYVDDNASAL